MMTVFPFAAIVGQVQVKLALRLLAVDPAIGGILVTGNRGTAKSTLARSFAALSIKGLRHMVTLPLGATEEMVTGTLDLQQALDDKHIKFAPGLLSKAHEGLLYVDEVNLLSDGLVDLLLDVAASGMNYVERDGISHEHDAKFVLMGTMNPDEGEVRPQLLDRFGLAVALDAHIQVTDRVTIMQRRQAFEADPEAFIASYQSQQEALCQQIHYAQDLLPHVSIHTNYLVQIAEACVEAKVEGMRGDLIWHKAAMAHAALMGRTQVEAEDIDKVADLVLQHRRQEIVGNTNPPSTSSPSTSSPSASSPSASSSNSSAPKQEPTTQSGSSSGSALPAQSSLSDTGQMPSSMADGASAQAQPTQSTQGDWGHLPAPQTLLTTDQMLTPAKVTLAKLSSYGQGRDLTNTYKAQSTPIRQGVGKGRAPSQAQGQVLSQEGRKINWFASLATRLRGSMQMQYYPQRGTHTVFNIILLDTSGSTLTHATQGQLQARHLVAGITRQAYLKRQGVMLIEFGNDQVHTVCTYRRSPKQINASLGSVTVGGGTPFVQALEYTWACTQIVVKQYPSALINYYIMTDGRVALPKHLPVRLEGRQSTGCMWLVDMEQSVVKRGYGQAWAHRLGADYYVLRQLVDDADMSVARSEYVYEQQPYL